MASEDKTPRQLIREALLDAWNADTAAVRKGDLEIIGDELLASLTLPTPAVAAAVAWACVNTISGEIHSFHETREMAEELNPNHHAFVVTPLYAHPSAGAGVTEEMAEALNDLATWCEKMIDASPCCDSCDTQWRRRYRALRALTRPTSEGREDAIPDEWSSDSAYRRRGRQ